MEIKQVITTPPSDTNSLSLRRHRGWLRRGFSTAVRILVVVHPHFERVPLDSNFFAEPVERHVILPVYSPPGSLREL